MQICIYFSLITLQATSILDIVQFSNRNLNYDAIKPLK